MCVVVVIVFVFDVIGCVRVDDDIRQHTTTRSSTTNTDDDDTPYYDVDDTREDVVDDTRVCVCVVDVDVTHLCLSSCLSASMSSRVCVLVVRVDDVCTHEVNDTNTVDEVVDEDTHDVKDTCLCVVAVDVAPLCVVFDVVLVRVCRVCRRYTRSR